MTTPFEQVKAILGEHFDNYVVIINEDPHECELEYNNAFAAKGMLEWAKNNIDSYYAEDHDDDNTEFIWDDDDDESQADF